MANISFEVGEHVFIQTGQYRNDYAPRYIDATVVKVLKTRVVVSYKDSKGFLETKRFVIPTYGAFIQEEGYVGDQWHHVQLVKDSEELAERRARHEASIQRERLNNDARTAARRVLESPFGGIETERVEAAIATLQALLDSRKEGE